MTFQESISKAIESQRNRLGITATELSKRLGISRQYYYMLKSKVVPEKLRTLDHGRPWSDDQFASTRLSSSRDMSR